MYASYIMTMYFPRSRDYVYWHEFDLFIKEYTMKHGGSTERMLNLKTV